MAWTAPATWLAGSTLTAAQLNEQVRDNSLAGGPIYTTEALRDAAIPAPFEGQRAFLTAPTTPTRTTSALTIYDGTVWVNVTPQGAAVVTSETTTSGTYADLATSGPAITMVTGTTALITVVSEISNTGANQTKMSFAVSGAGVVAASDDYSAANNLTTALTLQRTTLITGLTAGTNTFTAKYRVSAGTGSFFRRAISGVGIA